MRDAFYISPSKKTETMKQFKDRHIGLSPDDKAQMLAYLGMSSTEELIDKSIPTNILLSQVPEMAPAMTEQEYLSHMAEVALKNQVFRSYIGQGYYGTLTPSVIQRSVFENPGWYTQYTPYQAEISQGRLESLLNFQTMVSDFTDLPIANASLLDEATAAAEAMLMLFNTKNKRNVSHPRFYVDTHVYPQTLSVLMARAQPLGIDIEQVDIFDFTPADDSFGILVQYPDSHGRVRDFSELIKKCQTQDLKVVMATDLMALALLKSPGQLGADVAVGSTQRFGIPLGYGGPHAAFFACKEEYKREIPGRIIGVSVDAQGKSALRMALQTREQHIRREKATSNICTAQALLANMAAMYAVYHGPDGIRNIATQIHEHTRTLAASLTKMGATVSHTDFYDTIRVDFEQEELVKTISEKHKINFGYIDGGIQIALDETVSSRDIEDLVALWGQILDMPAEVVRPTAPNIPQTLQRDTPYLEHEIFNSCHSETQMLRYITKLERKDLALNTSMISLGSCTMKLNAATELMPLSWPEFANIHPHVPQEQAAGYHQIIEELASDLCKITGFDDCSLQPNSGAQGEYAGLYAIKKYHMANGQSERDIVLIPISAHGTNPASAAMMGQRIVIVACDEKGNIDVEDLKAKCHEHRDKLSALMVTYPSTHGVFEKRIKEICDIVHQHGGQVYMDGANMNAQVFYTSPAEIGADVCHLNLHKTFAIPHGGGGPGMGPICCSEHLSPYLPSEPRGHVMGDYSVSAAMYGSALILLISHSYIKMLGLEGLKESTEAAILSANYMRARLDETYDILYTSETGYCAHEFILDLREYKTKRIEAEDIAKRLMDYNFHAPTLSFPVPGTFMIEPTESEDKAELDRFCDAMLGIKKEIDEVMNDQIEKSESVLQHAPHTAEVVSADHWDRKYSRELAAFPLEYVRSQKFWPSCSRVNNTHGDRNLICTCPPTEAYASVDVT